MTLVVQLLSLACRVPVFLWMRICGFRPEKKKLLIIPDFGEFGGARTHFKSLVLFYRDEGWMIKAGIEKDLLDADMQQFLDAAGCEVDLIELRTSPRLHRKLNTLWIYLQRFYHAARLAVRFDASFLIVTTARFIYLSVFLLPLAVLFVLHAYPTSRLNALDQGIVLCGASRKRRVMSVSQFSVDAVKKFWMNNGPASRYVERLFPVQASWFEEEPPPGTSSRTCVLTLGHVAWTKNPDLWIEVARRVLARNSSVVFRWVGGGYMTDEHLEKCRASAADEPRIEFAGYHPDPAAFYDQCLVYFQPSKIESFGLSVAEAMRKGIPCVVTRVGGLAELVEDAQTGFICAEGDVECMADSILRLLDNEALRVSMGQAAGRRFEKSFSLGIWREEMKRIHAELTGVVLPGGVV